MSVSRLRNTEELDHPSRDTCEYGSYIDFNERYYIP